jgi:uncharacterized phage infection (PIP) family protein YhgE
MTDQTVLIRLGADASGLTKGLRDGRKGLSEFEGGVDSAVSKLEKLAAVAGLGLGLAELVKSAMEFSESMVSVAARTGASIEEVQRWDYIAKQTGTTVEALADAVNKMQKNLVSADEDGKKAADALESIGIGSRDLLALQPAEQFQKIAEGLSQIQNPAERVSVATDLLGKAGSAAIPTLLEMAEKAEEFSDGLARIGGAVSEDAVRAVEALGDQASETKQALTNLTTEVMASLAPALSALLTGATETVAGLRILGGGGGDAMVNLDNKITLAEENLKTMQATAYASFGGITQSTKDAIKEQEALIAKYREEYDAQAGLGVAGMQRAKDDKVINDLMTKNAEDLTASILSEDNLRAMYADALNMKIETGELTHQERMAQIRLDATVAQYKADDDFQEEMRNRTGSLHADMEAIQGASLTKLQQFQADSWKGQVATVSGSLMQMTAGIAQHSKAAFEVNKYATMANVIVNTIQAVTKAWSDYGWPVGAVMGAAIAVAGAAQLNAVKSQTFNGGGRGLPPSSATTPPVPVASAGGGGQAGGGQVLRVEGLDSTALFSGKAVRALAERLAEHQKDGGTVLFS